MGYFKIRRALAVSGGSVNIGADTNIYRTSANVLKTDDALTVTGTLTASAAATVGTTLGVTGKATLNGGVDSSGTITLTGRLVAPHGTASPTIATNGQVVVYTKSNVSYLGVHIGGTPNYIAFPAATHGTITVTVGGTP